MGWFSKTVTGFVGRSSAVPFKDQPNEVTSYNLRVGLYSEVM